MRVGVSRAAVLGAGRSGRAAARALMSLGVEVMVFDQAQLPSEGLNLVAGWDGFLPEEPFEAVVTSPGFRPDHPAILAAQARRIPIWSEPELAYRLTRAPILAVTGTNGKSTTTYMLYRMLREAGRRAHLCGNIAGSGEDKPASRAAVEAQEGDVLVAEVSSFQLEWVDLFRPHIAVLTRIDQDHLDRYDGDFERYAETKRRIFRRQLPEDYAVIGHAHVPEVAAHRVDFPEPTKGDCAFFRDDRFILRLGGVEHPLAERSDLGRHAVCDAENALAAATAAWLFGAPSEAIRRALQEYEGLPSRMRVLGTYRGVTFVDSSAATNPTSCAHTILSSDPRSRVLIGGVDKGNDPGPIVTACRRLERAPIVYGRMGPRLADRLCEAGILCEHVTGLEDAFRRAVAEAGPGDWVVLAPGGSSFDEFRDFLDRAARFRALVQEYAAEGGA